MHKAYEISISSIQHYSELLSVGLNLAALVPVLVLFRVLVPLQVPSPVASFHEL